MTEHSGAAVVVGHGSGVSRAVAEALASEGHPLALIARDGAKLDAAAESLRGQGARAAVFPADAGDPHALKAALEAARGALGEPEVAFYNAAHWRPGPLLQTADEAFEADLRVGLTGGFLMARELAPAMVARGRGTLLFTGGGLALHPSAQAPSLSVAKAGLRALALVLAEELAPKGVRVGTVTIAGFVAPGTPFAPDKIASAFLHLHHTTPDPATAEIVFRGEA